MKIKKLDKNQYEIINDDYIIYISEEQNPNTKLYLYFIDVFEHNNKNAYDNEVFDQLYLAIEYLLNNYQTKTQTTNQIKF